MIDTYEPTADLHRLTANETLAEAIEFDRLAEGYRAQGYCGIRAADLAYMYLYPYLPPRPHDCRTCPSGRSDYFVRLLRSMFDASDFTLHWDKGTWFAEATGGEVKLLRRYVKLRRSAPDWHPGAMRPTAGNSNPRQTCNHDRVDPIKLAKLLNPERDVETGICRQCRRTFERPTRRREYCTSRCRVKAHRRGRPATQRDANSTPVDGGSGS